MPRKLRRWLREGAILLGVLAGVINLLGVWRFPQMPAMFDSTPLHTLDGETGKLASNREERPGLLYFRASL
ncbi:protein disulfide oxidoreductase, partial [Escherichia coli]|nr:protein disulfide oxidoreductase [Escherichia coli]